jgi:hypothetical protein
MILRVPLKLLKQLRIEKGLPFTVGITANMVGEMKKPASILVSTTRLSAETLNVLLENKCREVTQ